jgi:hypothetical protein
MNLTKINLGDSTFGGDVITFEQYMRKDSQKSNLLHLSVSYLIIMSYFLVDLLSLTSASMQSLLLLNNLELLRIRNSKIEGGLSY